MKHSALFVALLFVAITLAAPTVHGQQPFSTDGNRFAYLDGPCDPYYPGTDFPKLITPQWVGEAGVEAVVILGIDDMRDTKKYEAYLRPILDRLKEIDGRAPVSIMTNKVDPKDPQLQTWLAEGVSLECHTLDHPCPLLKDGDFDKAAKTYQDCVDLMESIPNNKPVAFRMPCCDSLNTPSPKFFTEIFSRQGLAPTQEDADASNREDEDDVALSRFPHLTIDSSVFTVFTAEDKDLPAKMLVDKDGSPRFGKYIPFTSFVNTIKNYPYPYVINNNCWEFPCMVPSDWEAQNIQKPFNPKTVEDMKAALDLTVIKRGVMNLVFHPHGWIRNDQIVELIDHAVKKHGRKVKFLTFAEAQKFIDKNLLGGHSLRSRQLMNDGQFRLLDVNNDGYMDVICGRKDFCKTRIWNTNAGSWDEIEFPYSFSRPNPIVSSAGDYADLTCVCRSGGRLLTYCIQRGEKRGRSKRAWEFQHGKWDEDTSEASKLVESLDFERLHAGLDFDGDGQTDLVLPPIKPASGNESVSLSSSGSRRFVDINDDGKLDLIYSDEKQFGVYLFKDLESGWSITAMEGNRGETDQHFPVVSNDGRNNGAFFHSRHLWVQNEHTAKLPDLVGRISFDEMLKNVSDEHKPKPINHGRKAQEKNIGQPKAKSPEEALKTFRTYPELTIELVASEPLIADPVAFDWAADGSLWVVEMGDYPLGTDSDGTFGGKVRHLTDSNGDGVYDQSKTFLEKLPFPTGIKVWRDGVIVSTAPDVFFARDTDGDGKSDEQKVLFKGFNEGNQQHRVNGLRWGLDGWLHLANGDSGGEIESVRTGEKIDIRSSDLKINPDTGEMAATFGRAQFGRNRDDFGNWVGGNNSNPMWQYVLDQTRLAHSPHVNLPDVIHHVSDQPGASPLFPISKTLERFNDFDRANRFTSACSHMFFRDTTLGKDPNGTGYYGNAFICEPVHNLVHREVVSRDGIYLNSSRAKCESESEFLASSDSWFRPVMVRTGPDGALWIADMYRLVIEHPEWIPQEWQQKLDLQSGNNLGRIYRIHSKGFKPKLLNLANANPDELIDVMKFSNGTVRDMAHQLLLQTSSKISVAKLIEAGNDQNALPQARLQLLNAAKSVLDAKGDDRSKEDFLNESRIAETALADSNPYVVAFGVLFCDHLLKSRPLGEKTESIDSGRWRSDGKLTRGLRKLFDESDQRVQLELLYSYRNLGQLFDDDRLLFDLIRKNQGDPLMLAAALSSITKENATQLAELPWHELAQDVMQHLLKVLMKSGDAGQIAEKLFEMVLSEPGPFASETKRLQALSAIQTASAGSDLKPNQSQQAQLARWRSRARRIVDDSAGDAVDLNESVSAAIAVVGIPSGQSDEDRQLLLRLLDARYPPAIQSAAIEQLSRNGSQTIGEHLIRIWPKQTPAIRAQILNTLLRRDNFTELLLRSVESHVISIASLSAIQLDQLQSNLSGEQRQRLAQVTPLPSNVDRQKVIAEYSEKLDVAKSDGDGVEVFKKNCAACHKIGTEGNAIGPDLSALTNKSTETLLAAILDPNRAVEQKYTNYVVETFDGLQHSGVLVQETAGNIRLLNADQKEVDVSRSDIEALFPLEKSYMPEGFERDITPEQMSQLIRFLQSDQGESKQ